MMLKTSATRKTPRQEERAQFTTDLSICAINSLLYYVKFLSNFQETHLASSTQLPTTPSNREVKILHGVEAKIACEKQTL